MSGFRGKIPAPLRDSSQPSTVTAPSEANAAVSQPCAAAAKRLQPEGKLSEGYELVKKGRKPSILKTLSRNFHFVVRIIGTDSRLDSI